MSSSKGNRGVYLTVQASRDQPNPAGVADCTPSVLQCHFLLQRTGQAIYSMVRTCRKESDATNERHQGIARFFWLAQSMDGSADACPPHEFIAYGLFAWFVKDFDHSMHSDEYTEPRCPRCLERLVVSGPIGVRII
jgi:hypothetical protein